MSIRPTVKIMARFLLASALFASGCSSSGGSGGGGGSGGSGGQTAQRVRAVFALARQRDDLADLAGIVSNLSSPAYGEYRDVGSIAAEYGAAPETMESLNAFLGVYGASATLDVTGTFGTTLLSEEQVQAMFGSLAITPAVPAPLFGIVTAIVGSFDAFSDDGSNAILPPIPPLSGGQVMTASGWPLWAMGSGTHPTCPSEDPLDCTAAALHPGLPEEFQSFHPSQLRTAYGFGPEALRPGRTAVVLQFGANVAPDDIEA